MSVDVPAWQDAPHHRPSHATAKLSDETYGRYYVLKTYSGLEAPTYFKKERDAFRTVFSHKRDPNIIRYFGSYTQQKTYNIILEWADGGTLEDFLRNPNIDPPSTAQEIIAFWSGVFGLFDAVARISEPPLRIPDPGSPALDGPGYFQGFAAYLYSAKDCCQS